MTVKQWSTTPASNNSAPPNGWPEGQAPSTVNDCARQMMADLRSVFNDMEYFDYGDTPSRVSNSTFKIATDVTARYPVHTRLKCYDATTIYSTVTAVSYSAPDTTVTVVNDSGNLSSGLTSVARAIISPANTSIPSTIGRKGSDIASATTTDIWAGSGDFVDITGTTTITGLGTATKAGIERTVRFTGALTLTHNGTSLILPGAANITTAANDTAVFRSLDASGNSICVSYKKADGTAVVAATTGAPADAQYVTLATNGTLTVERVLTAGGGITLTDAGAGSTLTVASSYQYITSATASTSASLAFTGLTSSYSEYILVCHQLLPSTNDVDLWIRTSTNNGSSYDSSAGNYDWLINNGASGGPSSYESTSDTKIQCTPTSAGYHIGNGTGSGWSGIIHIINPSAAAYCKIIWQGSSYGATGHTMISNGNGRRLTAADVDAVQLLMSSGNIASGIIYLYGLKNS